MLIIFHATTKKAKCLEHLAFLVLSEGLRIGCKIRSHVKFVWMSIVYIILDSFLLNSLAKQDLSFYTSSAKNLALISFQAYYVL